MKTSSSNWPVASKPSLIFALVLSTLSSGACNLTDHSPTEPHGHGLSHWVVGSGTVVEEQRSIDSVDEIVLAGIGTVYVEQGAHESLVVRAEDNLLPYLRTEAIGRMLRIDTEPDVDLRPTRPIEFLLTLSSLSRAELSGAGDINGVGLVGDRLSLGITGAGRVRFTDLAIREFEARLSGAGEIVASGTADQQRVTISGAGDYRGRDLSCSKAEVAILGVGSATVRVSDRLVADIAGVGSVYYIGNPTVEATVTGSGDVVRIGD